MPEEFQIVNILDALESMPEELLCGFLDTFECRQNKPIERFLKEYSLQNARQRFSITYLVVNECNELAGYFALANKPVRFNRASLSGKYLRRVRQFCRMQEEEPGWSGQYVASGYLIAQLAKNSRMLQGKKPSGSDLLNFAFAVLQDVQKKIGGGIVFLECEDNPKVLSFYQREKFFLFGERLSEDVSDVDDICTGESSSSVLYHQLVSVF